MPEQPSAAPRTDPGARVALANLDGHILPLADAKVSALDRGFLFGDAVYEVLRVYAGRPWLANEHYARLAHSLAAIRIRGVDLTLLRQRMTATIAAGDFQEAIVYIQVTRGSAPRGHAFPTDAAPLEFLYVQEFADPYVEARDKGASVILQPDIRWGRCDIKSTNLLANVLALQAAKEADGVEAILYLPDGTLTEGTHSSLFGVRHGQLITAAQSASVLPGVTRNFLAVLAAKNEIPVRERNLHRDELFNIDELFLSGTTTEVLPIARVDAQLIANGSPGPVTRRVRLLYQDAVRIHRA
jgi:D-alanine transaminase